jgi:tetraprenyl-beta-curcumene synthase
VSVDPTPLGLRQGCVLLRVAARELTWVIPNVSRELTSLRRRARAIPDATLRELALETLRLERLNAEGAALFAVLPVRRSRPLLCLLVRFQAALDYLDTISEGLTVEMLPHGFQLHRALVEALDPLGPVSDYYRYRPSLNDGGYLESLVMGCRCNCAQLPGYAVVHQAALRASRRLAVQVLNHLALPAQRDAALEAWAQRECGEGGERWFELTAAASSTLGLFALLALGAEAAADRWEIAEIEAAYHPWISAACTFLDSFVDQADDAATGNHSYVAHYPSPEAARERLCEIVHESARQARALRRGTRHALIATGMVSMYLSKDSAREPALRDDADAILAAAGSLPRVQMPIMRVMRRLHGLRSA